MRTDVNSSVPAGKTSRSLMLTKLALGAALTLSLAGFVGATPAAAQDDEIVLSSGGATLTVSPGNAKAEGAAASAEAGPGWAVTEAAAARAVADSDCGAMTEGSNPNWETSAVAMPDIGAEVDAAIAKAKATAEETAAGTDVETADLKAEFEKCVKEDKEERKVEPPKEEEIVYEEPEYVPVEEVPSTGAGAAQAGLAGLMGAAAAAAALGAVALRRREDAASIGAR